MTNRRPSYLQAPSEARSPAEYASPITTPDNRRTTVQGLREADDEAFAAFGHGIVTRLCAWGCVLALLALALGMI